MVHGVWGEGCGGYPMATFNRCSRRLRATTNCSMIPEPVQVLIFVTVDLLHNYKQNIIINKIRQTASTQIRHQKKTMAAAQTLTGRTAQYVDTTKSRVDINKCVPGAHARAIKPGGIDSIKSSIQENGYRRVL
jgi:hypothetical protein